MASSVVVALDQASIRASLAESSASHAKISASTICTSNETQAPRPREQLPIPLFDSAVLAVRGADGRIFLGLRDLCGVLGLALAGQRRRIRSHARLTLLSFRVIIQGQLRDADFLLLEDVPLWLLTVQINRVGADVHERVDYIQTYLVASVQRAFGELTGLALGEQPSSAIEDLRELDRMDAAFAQLAALSGRQDRAAQVVRDIVTELRELRGRVQELEALALAHQPGATGRDLPDGAGMG